MVPGRSPVDLKQIRLAAGGAVAAKGAFAQTKLNQRKAAIARAQDMLRTLLNAFTTARAIIGEGGWVYQPRWPQFRFAGPSSQKSTPANIHFGRRS